ncbi:alanine racemase [uncultured Mailhella sp.]|uniref:alanine racemase n=1 Tax=uncultured Mailhella sp. TaxID=1981031 RepID=UPI0025E6304F|nr:alanine racemase [uncultured Mailhella sp.]
MPRLVIKTDVLRRNLAVIHELCRRAGAICMFVFKEAPLHPRLTADIMKGSPVRRLGVVAWPGHGIPDIADIQIHHIYAPSSMLARQAAACSCVYIDSLFTLRTLALCRNGNTPQIRLCLEAGDGRDGAPAEELPELSEHARSLGLSIRGLTVNFACLSREAPTIRRLQDAIQALRGIRDCCTAGADISAGGTDMLELAAQSSIPPAIAEIRCGTGITLGVYPLSGRPIPGTRQDAFQLEAQILESRIKNGRRMVLLDMGTFHTAPECLRTPLPGMIFSGASSAYTSFDVTNCPESLREGLTLSFIPDYHALSRALFSQALPITLEEA